MFGALGVGKVEMIRRVYRKIDADFLGLVETKKEVVEVSFVRKLWGSDFGSNWEFMESTNSAGGTLWWNQLARCKILNADMAETLIVEMQKAMLQFRWEKGQREENAMDWLADFLQAKIGGSVLEGRKVMEKGILWEVGRGLSIHITEDSWVKDYVAIRPNLMSTAGPNPNWKIELPGSRREIVAFRSLQLMKLPSNSSTPQSNFCRFNVNKRSFGGTYGN
ncbi:hypothetical protein PIB30_059140 [Stylosanthes scabra]|uniref:Uncharacterized protein n=1 Tax=Stylosanthes scabra TaxID=79078 RepID=A0ABU6WLC6_9FABA|nr:hypothetical protein [Stylosanthes scabra]